MPANFNNLWQSAIHSLYDDSSLQLDYNDNCSLAFKDIVKRLSNAFQIAIKHIHSVGNYNASMLTDKDIAPLIIETNNAYNEALRKGIEKRPMPDEMLTMLQDNIFIFSGFKTNAQLSDVASKLLLDNSKLKSFEQFKRDVKQIDKDYNENYLRAEYNFAVSSSRSAAMWHSLTKDVDDYYLQYRTAKDERVRAEHALLDETTLPADSKFWKDYFPPNGWNCRCTVVKVLKDKYAMSDEADAIAKGIRATTKINKKGENKAAIFRFNPGIEQKVFPPRHPYFKVPKKEKEIIEEAVNKTKNELEVEKALGIKKGKPMTFEEANEQKGNVDYAKGKQFSINCQSCVVANELRRRGFDVTALGNTKGSIPEQVSADTALPWIDPKTKAKPEKTNCGGWLKSWIKTGKKSNGSLKKVTKELDEATKEIGRYHIDFVWKRKNSGHIITVERLDNGKLRFYDPQIGKRVLYASFAYDVSLKYGIDVLKVDNLDLNPDIIKGVVRKL